MPAGLRSCRCGEVFPGLSGDRLDELADDHVENIVVSIAVAKTRRRLDVAQAFDGFGAADVAAWHEKQIALRRARARCDARAGRGWSSRA